MDFIEDLPKSHGNDTIMVMVFRLSKFDNILSLKHPFSAYMVASLLVKEIVRLHRFPNSIVSDHDKKKN